MARKNFKIMNISSNKSISITLNNYSMSEVPTLISNFIIDKKYDVVPFGKIDSGIPFKLLDEDGKNIEDNSIGKCRYYNTYGEVYFTNKKKKVI